MEDQEFTGVWRLPESEEGTYGTLKFSPDKGSRLSTVNSLDSSGSKYDFLPGPLQSLASASEGQASRHPIVQGKDLSGTPITLVNVIRDRTSVGWSSGGGFGEESEYVASRILVGKWFDENPEFDYIKARFPHLEKWTEIAPIKQEIEVDDASEGPTRIEAGDKIKLVFEMPEKIEADLGDYTVSLVVNGGTEQKGESEKSLKAEVFIKIESEEAETLDMLEEQLKQVQNFVSFGMVEPLQPVKLEAGWEEERNDVEVLRRIDTEILPEKLSHPDYMNFTFADIQDDFEDVLRTWFNKAEELKPVFDLYFGALQNPNMYIENRLLGFAHAVESYFRETGDATYLDDEWEDVYQDFIDFMHGDADQLVSGSSSLETLQSRYNLGKDFRRHMEGGTLEYANEYSLRKMVEELTGRHEAILEEINHNPIGKAELIADTRNYLVHRTEELREKAVITPEDQIKLVWSLRLLLETSLLRELGIDDEHISDRLGTRYENMRASPV
ncbi:MAG: HEPN domain-containing protein [Candidatus Nanohaloarchaea archaeon]